MILSMSKFSTHIQTIELNAIAMITKINCLQHHIVLYKEVNPNEHITYWLALDFLWGGGVQIEAAIVQLLL